MCNLIGLPNLKRLVNDPILAKTNYKLEDVQKNAIKTLGEFIFRCNRDNKKYDLVFQVVEFEHQPLLSEKACRTLQLVRYCKSINSLDTILASGKKEAMKILDRYSDIFEGYGKLPDTIELEINENVKPVVAKPRRIAHCYRELLKHELDDMESNGLIEKEPAHSEWVSNILIVERGGKIRICLDPMHLNKALKRPHYPFNTIEEILTEVDNAKVFSVVDLKKGFMQLELTKESSKLTTFWTPYGKYKFKRLCFGLTSSPEYFQMMIYRHLHDLEGIEVMADDILIFGSGKNINEAILSHNKRLENLFIRLNSINCKLNRSKAVICEEEVKFYGNFLSSKGMRADPEKVSAIQNLPAPESKKDLERFLGMVNYQGRYINNASAECEYLRNLTRKHMEWKWTKKDMEEFERLKKTLGNLKTLKFFEVGVPVLIECDASIKGLGAVILQRGAVVAYASRTLTKAEKNYAQIEKELLAILFACKRFEQYIIGNTAKVHTDHKSLINIYHKTLLGVPRRLQMMMLYLHSYGVELQYVPGKELIIADTLSRAPSEMESQISFEKISVKAVATSREKYIKNISSIKLIDNVNITDQRLNEILKATMEDSSLQIVTDFIKNGWPNNIHKVPDSVKIYYKFKDELAIENGLLFRLGKLLIPQKLRKQMVDRLHLQHSGIENTINLAKDNLFWPGMRDQVKSRV
jgi:hypothetical protein